MEELCGSDGLWPLLVLSLSNGRELVKLKVLWREVLHKMRINVRWHVSDGCIVFPRLGLSINIGLAWRIRLQDLLHRIELPKTVEAWKELEGRILTKRAIKCIGIDDGEEVVVDRIRLLQSQQRILVSLKHLLLILSSPLMAQDERRCQFGEFGTGNIGSLGYRGSYLELIISICYLTLELKLVLQFPHNLQSLFVLRLLEHCRLVLFVNYLNGLLHPVIKVQLEGRQSEPYVRNLFKAEVYEIPVIGAIDLLLVELGFEIHGGNKMGPEVVQAGG